MIQTRIFNITKLFCLHEIILENYIFHEGFKIHYCRLKKRQLSLYCILLNTRALLNNIQHKQIYTNINTHIHIKLIGLHSCQICPHSLQWNIPNVYPFLRAKNIHHNLKHICISVKFQRNLVHNTGWFDQRFYMSLCGILLVSTTNINIQCIN